MKASPPFVILLNISELELLCTPFPPCHRPRAVHGASCPGDPSKTSADGRREEVFPANQLSSPSRDLLSRGESPGPKDLATATQKSWCIRERGQARARGHGLGMCRLLFSFMGSAVMF